MEMVVEYSGSNGGIMAGNGILFPETELCFPFCESESDLPVSGNYGRKRNSVSGNGNDFRGQQHPRLWGVRWSAGLDTGWLAFKLDRWLMCL
jgi:hypothetical protein